MASLRFSPRICLERALSDLDEKMDNAPTLFLQLPTGYGKTSVTLSALLASQSGNPFIGDRIIHVLPLRSIVQDIKMRISNDLEKLGKSSEMIAAQSMGSPGSPFFAKRLVVTTLDTFSLNLFKLPAWEVTKEFRSGTSHFEVPRGFVYPGTVVFDEAHLFSLTESTRPLTILLTSMECLATAGVPIIVMTATLPTVIREYLARKMENRNSSPIAYSYSKGDDKQFEETSGKRCIATTFIDSSELVSTILEVANRSDGRVLVVVNEIRRAIELAKSSVLAPFKPDLIHGGLVEFEKEKKIHDLLLDLSSKIVISTQVVEAGIDMKNISILVSDLAPMDRLVQRVGRVARKGGRGEMFVVIRDEDLQGKGRIYDPALLKSTKDIICKEDSTIDWTLDIQGLVDKAYSNIDVEEMINPSLNQILCNIDEDVLCEAHDTMQLLKGMGSFVRDTALVKAFAPPYISDGRVRAGGFTSVESYKAKKIFLGNMKLVRESSVVSLPEKHGFLAKSDPLLFPLLLEGAGYDGIILDHYEPWIGYQIE